MSREQGPALRGCDRPRMPRDADSADAKLSQRKRRNGMSREQGPRFAGCEPTANAAGTPTARTRNCHNRKRRRRRHEHGEAVFGRSLTSKTAAWI